MDESERARRCADAMYAKDAASQAFGITVEVPRPGHAVARMRVRPDMVNGFGICHGGLVFTLADTAFAFACNAYDQISYAGAASIEFLRPARLGDELEATAREDYRGGKTGFYTAEVRDQQRELVAMFRGRSATRGESLL